MNELFEIVVEGPYVVIKAFCAGMLSGMSGGHQLLFSRDRGIGRSTLLERLKVWAHIGENMSHLVVDREFKEKLDAALKTTAPDMELSVISTKPVASSQFKFRYAAYSRSIARQLKELLDDPPRGVTLRNYRTKEKVIASAKGPEGYAPLHDFELHGEGEVMGSLLSVVAFRERLVTHAMLQADEIELIFGENALPTANRGPGPTGSPSNRSPHNRNSGRRHPRRRSSGGPYRSSS